MVLFALVLGLVLQLGGRTKSLRLQQPGMALWFPLWDGVSQAVGSFAGLLSTLSSHE